MRTWLRLVPCVFAAGCISATVQPLDRAVRPARAPETVAVLLEAPARPYTVIAVVDVTGKTVFDGFDDLRERVIAEAAKLGGEAVILGRGVTDSEFILTGTAMVTSDRRMLSGEVIVFGQG